LQRAEGLHDSASLLILSHLVPPLTQGNILEAVKGVQDQAHLIEYFGFYPTRRSIEDTVEDFLLGRGFYQPSWRAVIFTLDLVGKTQIADRIRNHGEPIQGVCVYVCVCVSHQQCQ
jgi:hypothetical protein